MGLFNALGRKVESFKQQVDEAATGTYACEDCGERFHTAHDACPACGADAVETV